jgi:predicted ATP-dependent endonuclease of OLD family
MAQERLMVKNFGPIKEIDIEVKDVNVLIGTTGSGKSTIAKLLVIFRSLRFLMERDKTSFFPKQLRDMNIDFLVSDQTEIHYRCDDFFVVVGNGKVDSNIDAEELLIQNLNFASAKNYFNDPLDRFLILANFFSEYLTSSSDENPEKNRSNDRLRKLFSFLRLTGEASEKERNRLALKYKPLEPLNDPLYIPAERILISMVGSSIMGLLNNDVAIAKCMTDFGAKFETARKELE